MAEREAFVKDNIRIETTVPAEKVRLKAQGFRSEATVAQTVPSRPKIDPTPKPAATVAEDKN